MLTDHKDTNQPDNESSNPEGPKSNEDVVMKSEEQP